jgi:hypothetical protein
MTEAAEKTRFQTLSVPENEVPEWCAVEWSYVGVDESRLGYGIIKWEHNRQIVRPFSEAMRVSEAVSLFEGDHHGQ